MQVRRTPVVAVAAICLATLLVPLLPLADPSGMDLSHSLAAASLAHPLGQDEFGRDVLSRLLWSARLSLFIAAASASLACLPGIVLGLIGGSLRGVAARAVLRGMDVALCFPPLLFALFIVTLRGPGMATLIAVLALLLAPGFVRASCAGPPAVRSRGTIFHGILPNVSGPVLVHFSLAVASAMALESGLSFLGLGVVPPELSWGLMIGAARAVMSQAPLLLLWPCAALSMTILAMMALYDALRDATTAETRPVRRRRPGSLPPPPPSRPAAGTAVLDVRNLTVEIDTPHGALQAVRDVSFTVSAGETIAIAGDGGSLIGLAIMGLLPQSARASQGSAWLQGHNLLRLDRTAFRRVRGGVLSMVLQDPRSSVNPVHRIGAQIAEAMHAHFEVADYEAKEEVEALLGRVGIPDPGRAARAYPHELTDSVLQRAMVAMAIANDPRLLIADEPAAQVLDLLADLQRELRMGLVVISQNLPAAAAIADSVLVLQAGEIVEQGPAHAILTAPTHPHTAALLQGVAGGDSSFPGRQSRDRALYMTAAALQVPFAHWPASRYL